MNKKVLFVSCGKDPRDKTAWSGTPYSVYNELSKQYTVITYTINDKIILGAKCYFKAASLVTKKLYLYDHSIFLAKYAAKAIKKKVLESNCDCVFIIGGMLAAYLDINCPIIVLGDAVFSSMVDYYWFNLSSKTKKEGDTIQQKIFENADKVILTSQWAIEEAKKNYIVQENQIELVHFGPNIAVEKVEKEIHTSINLLFVGVDWERKGGSIAVECVERLNEIDDKNEYYLNIVGCLSPDRNMNNYVKFWGFLNNNNAEEAKTLNYIRSQSDLFILPTKAECSAIVFCEAAAFSLPVVTFDTGGNKDYVIENYNGICLPLTSSANDFADAIFNLVNNEEMFNNMKTNAHQYYMEELNWNVFGNKVKTLIDDLL